MDNETGEASVEEIGTMSLGEGQSQIDSEMAPTVLGPLRSIACCEEGSGEKEDAKRRMERKS